MSFTARLLAYTPAGARLNDLLLDGVSWDAQMPLNDVAALSLMYPAVVDGIGLASEPVELAVEVSSGDNWVEPRNGRFLTSEVDSDLVRPLDVPSLKFRGLGALLARPQVLRESENAGRPYNSDGKRNFLSATPGQIVASVLLESRARYATMLQGISLAFDASLDSRGAAWGKLDSVAYEPGTDLLRILDDLASRGLVDWWMQGRALHVVNGDSVAVETGITVPLLDADSAPVRMTHESRATHVAVEGGQAKVWEQPVPGAQVPYGAKVVRIANDSITSDGTAQDLINRQIVQASGSRREYTTSLQLLEHAPFLDFEVGDWVLARTGSPSADAAGVERVRVHAVTIRWDQSSATVGCDLTLNDRFVDASVRDAKRMQGIVHGATQVLGDGGVPSRSDRAIPAAPQGVSANSLGYWSGAIPLSSVDVAWQAVQVDVDGLALNGVDFYEVRVGGQTKRAAGTSVSFDGLQPSRIYDITVRAISRTGISGRWSAATSVTTAFPLPNLDPPTRPTFRTENAAVEVIWDGKLQGSGAAYAPPRHFAYTLVEVQKVGGSWTRYERDAGWVLVGLTAGDEWNARLIAVDALGRESQPSPVGQVVVKSAAQEAQQAANDAMDEAELARGEAFAAASRIDMISGELDTTAQQAQDAWNLALEATANATQRVNLLPNPSFENGSSAWISAGCTTSTLDATHFPLMWQDLGGRSHSNILQMISTASSGVAYIRSRNLQLDGATHVGFAALVAGDHGVPIRLEISWLNAAGSSVGASATTSEPANFYPGARRVAAFAAPATATQYRVDVTMRPPAVGARVWVDSLITAPAMSEQAALVAVDHYFDGSTPDRTDSAGILYRTEWTGTPHASTSIETAFTSAMLDLIQKANAATEAAALAGGKADTADAEARGAREDAAAAAGLAASKTDVLIQSTAPTAAMQKPTTLWIDTTAIGTPPEPGNIPKRWSGAAWMAVQDKTAVDAAARAAAADSKATQALAAAGGKNAVFRSVSLPGTTQGTAVGDVWWRYADSSLEGPIIGQWTWNGTAWRPATIDSSIIANLTVDKLVVTGGAKFPLAVIDTLVGDDAFFSRVMANQVVVTPDNIIPGVSTIRKSTAGWEAFDRNLSDPSYRVQGRADKETSIPFTVVAGTEYTFEVEARASVGGTSFYVQAIPKSGQTLDQTYIVSDQRLPGTGWNTVGATWTPSASGEITLKFHANHANGTANTSGYQWFREPTMRKRVGAILLKDGVVTAPKIASQAVTTDALRTGLLDAFLITSPAFQSVTAANRGIKWLGSEFVAWNNSGQEMFRLSGNTGEIKGMTVTGALVRTGVSGPRVQIGVSAVSHGVDVFGFSAEGTGPKIRLFTSTGDSQYGLYFLDPGSGDPRMTLRDNEIRFFGAGSELRAHISATAGLTLWSPGTSKEALTLNTFRDGAGYGYFNLDGPVQTSNRGRLTMGVENFEGNVTSVTMLEASQSTDRAYVRMYGNGSWWLGSNTRGRINLDNASGQILVVPRSGLLGLYNLPTTTSTGQPLTMIVSGAGSPYIYRNTSLREAKLLIEDLDVDPYRVLELQPRTFYDRRAWEEFADGTEAEWLEGQGEEPAGEAVVFKGRAMPSRIPGLIAEEVEEIIPELASYDGDGRLVGVQYDRVPEYLLLALRALKAEVDQLKEARDG